MPAYKDEKKGTWYVSFHYFDWTGKNVRKLKRGFATKRKAQEWEQSFLRTKAASMDMTFSEFFTVYEKDVRPKLKENTWWSKEHIIRTKIIPYFGNTKMVDVTVRDIIKWQNMMREYRDSEGKPYSPTYLKSVQAQLSCLFTIVNIIFDKLKKYVYLTIYIIIILVINVWLHFGSKNSRRGTQR